MHLVCWLSQHFPAINLHLVRVFSMFEYQRISWRGPSSRLPETLAQYCHAHCHVRCKDHLGCQQANQGGHCWGILLKKIGSLHFKTGCKVLNPCPERGTWTWVNHFKSSNWKPYGNASIFWFWHSELILFCNQKPSRWMWRKYSTHQTRYKLYSSRNYPSKRPQTDPNSE